MPPDLSRKRQPLSDKSSSFVNPRTQAGVRLVPATPPRLLGTGQDDQYQRTTPPGQLPSDKGKMKADMVELRQDHVQLERGRSPDLRAGEETIYALDRSKTSPPEAIPRSTSRKRLQIHDDGKTFSLVQIGDDPCIPRPSFSSQTPSPGSSFSLVFSSRDFSRTSSSAYTPRTSDGVSKSFHTLPTLERGLRTPPDVSTNNASPWNYRFVGGLRKVAATPDLKLQSPILKDSLPSLPETDGAEEPILSLHNLSTKPSFKSQSTESMTTSSEHTNYKVHHVKSGPDLGSMHSLTSPVIYRPATTQSSDFDDDLDVSYGLLDRSSPISSLPHQQPPREYSQESLIIAPLKPRAKRSSDSFRIARSRSGESLRTTSRGSSSIIVKPQEANRGILGSGIPIQLPPVTAKLATTISRSRPLSSHPNKLSGRNLQYHWSSQLSTVPSMSEGGTDRESRTWSNDSGWRHSLYQSAHSRQSELFLSQSPFMEETGSISRTGSSDILQNVVLHDDWHYDHINKRDYDDDLDEYRDGIMPMKILNKAPSYTRLAGIYQIPSDIVRSNTMRSTTSSRTNSLLSSSLPAWAKLYYGGGERRLIGLASVASSIKGNDSRANSFRSHSPDIDYLTSTIYNPRRMPHENHNQVQDGTGRRGNDFRISPIDPHLVVASKKTTALRTWSMSSVWSPHLRTDRRVGRRSVWEPPLSWRPTGDDWYDLRNIQIVLFVAGWIIPFAWMIGAVLPLPTQPTQSVVEIDHETNSPTEDPVRCNHSYSIEGTRYQSVKWWRNVNRVMSLLGLLIIVVITILVVVGLRQSW